MWRTGAGGERGELRAADADERRVQAGGVHQVLVAFARRVLLTLRCRRARQLECLARSRLRCTPKANIICTIIRTIIHKSVECTVCGHVCKDLQTNARRGECKAELIWICN